MKKTILFTVFLIYSISGYSQENRGRGLQLLEIAPTPTQLATSEASLATPLGSASVYSNPGLLALSERSSINLGYTNWISDSNNLFGGINLVNNRRAIAFSFYSSGVTGLEQRDQPGASNGDFSVQYLSISGAFSYDFKIFSAGISGQYLNEEIYLFRASGYSFNAGIARSFLDNRLRLGASVLNIGEMEELNTSASDLPTRFAVGAAVDLIEFTHGKSPDLPILATIMADYIIPTENVESDISTDYNADESYFNLGLTLEIAETVEVNAGYKSGDNARPFSFGAGFLLEDIQFNYALIPFNTGFGTVHSIGIQYQL